MSRPLVVVVAKQSLYERFIKEQREPKAMALFQRRDLSVSNWRAAHTLHQRTVKRVQAVLRGLGARITVINSPAVVFDASDASLVVTVGGDGTLLAASHHVGPTPIMGVNSAPEHSVGFFCAAHTDNLEQTLSAALEGSLPQVVLSRMQVSVNNLICSRRVLNEALFCHAIPAATSRYILSFRGESEEHRSSGVWVGTAAGSTAATRSAGGRVLPFGSHKLQVVVREPYCRPGFRISLGRIIVEPPATVTMLSKMEDARLYLDGPFRQIPVALGDRVTCGVSGEPLCVLGLNKRRVQMPSQPPPPPSAEIERASEVQSEASNP